MPDIAGSIITRIRAAGANIELDGDRLRIVNGRRVSDDLRAELRQHGKAVAGWLQHQGNFEERAAIIEFDGRLSRKEADDIARLLLASPPKDCNPADWTWFVGKASEIIDAGRRAA